MYLSEKEVTLHLTSRPLRLVYLVGNREEFQNAVKLYTHIWGGLTNAIIPIHEDDLDIDLLKHKIILINPDFIFFQLIIFLNLYIQILRKFYQPNLLILTKKKFTNILREQN